MSVHKLLNTHIFLNHLTKATYHITTSTTNKCGYRCSFCMTSMYVV